MGRRLEIDAVRGLMLVWMVLTHLPTFLPAYTNQPFGFVSASEGFIFLSALFTGRIYFRLASTKREIALNKELWTVFTFYMDAVMRGRFRRYCGPQVKGVSLVNLFLYEKGLLSRQRYAHMYGRGRWTTLLSDYGCDVEFDYSRLVGTTQEKNEILVDTFIKYASRSRLPQMKSLVADIRSSRNNIDYTSIIKRFSDGKRRLGIKW